MEYPSIDKDNYPLGFLFKKGEEQPNIVQGKTGATTFTTQANGIIPERGTCKGGE